MQQKGLVIQWLLLNGLVDEKNSFVANMHKAVSCGQNFNISCKILPMCLRF
jgi:hypothetical protein